MKKKYKNIIEKHLYIAKTLVNIWNVDCDTGAELNTGAKSDLDALFLMAVPNKVWAEYRHKNSIPDMKISPYYNNDSLKETK